MFRKKVSVLQLLKPAFVILLGLYAMVTTVAMIKMRTEVVLIGIDGKNTRVITQDTDALLEAEKVGFIFGFLDSLYAYDQASFERKSKDAKLRMSPELWRQKQAEIDGIDRKIRDESLSQRFEVETLWELDKFTYVAELRLKIDRRSMVTEIPLKVKIKLRKRIRDSQIPYPIEVEALNETKGETKAAPRVETKEAKKDHG